MSVPKLLPGMSSTRDESNNLEDAGASFIESRLDLRDEQWAAEVERQRKLILDVHDALHAECDGNADLPTEIRRLRGTEERLRAALDRIARLTELGGGPKVIGDIARGALAGG